MSKRHTNTMRLTLCRIVAAAEQMLLDAEAGVTIPHDTILRDRLNDIAAQIEGYNEAEIIDEPAYAPIVLGRRGVHVF